MFSKLKKWNTLRNQLSFVFLVVMATVLALVSVLTYNQVSSLLKSNAEKQIDQTAVEANGRLESLYKQINTATKLVMTNNNIQRVLSRAYEGKTIDFYERQELGGIVNTIQANTDGIFEFELYTRNMNRILPLDDSSLLSRIDKKWIIEADKANGGLVWLGDDPRNTDNFMALRRVNLIGKGYDNGGYLLISIYSNYLQFENETDHTNQFSILLDKDMNPILSNYEGSLAPMIENPAGTLSLDNQDYIVTRQTSQVTGWTLIILTPVKELTAGINVLRMVVIISGVTGFIIFLVSSLFLSSFITRPIIKLTETMQQASAGSMTMNPSVTTANEINELNSTYNQLAKETNHLIKMVYEKEITRSRSELKALQAQINPHFLFNTLDALKWTLEEKDEEELAEFVVAMSELFRYTITKQTNGDWVTIHEETQHIENYMEIMKMRFGDQLKWNLFIEPRYQDVKIPKLLIQPLVENAVLHGAGNTMDPCTISISVEPAEINGYLIVMVEDDGPGIETEKMKAIQQAMLSGGVLSNQSGNGMAMTNVQKRLELYYPTQPKTGLEISSELGEGTKVWFVIPLKGEEEHAENHIDRR
ncbi:sensor histidine kinase [Rossellomorea vietnamensis]|uniref:histidine kinase n=2 Tax=Rossellomorea TaxID=2837508 RepID=A0A5D4K9W4_9BACI|nr:MULTISPECIES: sensor histidine kinase [Rossellomorea]TYR73545.1 sensor histidine kinase [Rossellomorea vietnamensis]TYS75524.1 sensor histidine kinase [Rossellomorea aquimaris]